MRIEHEAFMDNNFQAMLSGFLSKQGYDQLKSAEHKIGDVVMVRPDLAEVIGGKIGITDEMKNIAGDRVTIINIQRHEGDISYRIQEDEGWTWDKSWLIKCEEGVEDVVNNEAVPLRSWTVNDEEELERRMREL